MQSEGRIEDSGLSPSFNCYSVDSITSTTIANVIREDVLAEDFEFPSSAKENNSQSGTLFPGFSRDIQINDGEGSESPSYSSSETDELENILSGTFCIWSPKVSDEGSSSPKCKKSNSTGSSKKWRIRYFLRRSNSDGKEPTVILNQKQKQKQNPVLTVGRRLKAQTPAHELFYVQRRAENEVGRKKTYLPYRKDLVGLFGNVNGMGRILPF